jgi:hypothetical protein
MRDLKLKKGLTDHLIFTMVWCILLLAATAKILQYFVTGAKTFVENGFAAANNRMFADQDRRLLKRETLNKAAENFQGLY